MEDLLIKILTDCEAWISNGQIKIYEQSGTYYITRRIPGGTKWQAVAQFDDLAVALAKYIELESEE